MSMTHAECQDLLLDLAYGELDAARAAEVELHLKGCDECRAEQAKLNGTRAAFAPILSAGSVEEPGPGFDSPILAAAREAAAAARVPKAATAAPRSTRAPRKLHWMRAGVIGSIAAAAALAIIVSTGKTDKVIGEPPRSAEERAIAEKRGAEAKQAQNTIAVISSSPAQAQAAAPAAPPPAPAAGGPIADNLRPSDAARPDLATKAAEAPPPPALAPAQRRFAPPPPSLALKEKAAVNGGPTGAVAKREEPARDASAVDGERTIGSVSASNGVIAGAGAGAAVAKSAPSFRAGQPGPIEAEEDKDQLDKKRATAAASGRLSSETNLPAPTAASPKVAATAAPPASAAAHSDDQDLARAPYAGNAKSVRDVQSLESQASAARASGRLAEAAALYVRAAHAAVRSVSSLDSPDDSANAATAAQDFLSAIRCHLALGHISEARQVRGELAAVSPPQPDALARADEAISTASNGGR